MTKARTARFNAKRKTIVEAGTRILNRTGLSGFGLTEVAAEAGLKRPGIVYYFANAEELAEDIYSGALDQIEHRIETAGKAADPAARLGNLIELELRHHAAERRGEAIRRPQLGEIRALSPERRRRLGQRYHAILGRVAALLEVDGRQGRPIDRLGPAQIVMETVFWLPAWIDDYEPWMFDRVRDSIVDVLVNGYALTARHPRPATRARPLPDRKGAIDLEDYMRTATRLICASGFRGGSIDRIARELGVTKGSFYHHLDEKMELIEACFAHSQNRLSKLQREASEQRLPPVERLARVLQNVVEIQLDGRFPLLRTSALPALSAEARAKIIAQSRRNFRWYASELMQGIFEGEVRQVDPHIAAQVIGVAVNAVYDLSRLSQGAVSFADAPAFCALLERGITGLDKGAADVRNPGLQSQFHKRSMFAAGREKTDH
jgi:AcrR family transcriptional regulator